MIQKLFFVFGAFALWALSLLQTEHIKYRNTALGLIVLIALLSVFVHSFSGDLQQPPYHRFITFSLLSEGFIYIVAGCLLFLTVVKNISHFDLFIPIFILTIANMLMAHFQAEGFYFLFGGIKQTTQMNICGFMGTKSQLAVFSALSIPILFRKHWIFSLLAIDCLYLSHSYTGAVAAIICVFLYIFLHKKIHLTWALIPLAILPFIPWHKFSGIRPYTWKYTANEIIQKPLLGWGWDNTLAMNQIIIDVGTHIKEVCYRHNDYLNVARDMGIPFLLLILWIVLRVFFHTKKDMVWWSLLILAICCFNQYSFYYPRIAVWGIVMLALKERELYESKKIRNM